MNEFLTLICDAIEHMNIGGFTKLRELEPELKRQYDVLDQQIQWDCLAGVAEVKYVYRRKYTAFGQNKYHPSALESSFQFPDGYR